MTLRLSQAALGRLAGIDRIYVHWDEIGGRRLNADQEIRIQDALREEAQRLQDAVKGVLADLSKSRT